MLCACTVTSRVFGDRRAILSLEKSLFEAIQAIQRVKFAAHNRQSLRLMLAETTGRLTTVCFSQISSYKRRPIKMPRQLAMHGSQRVSIFRQLSDNSKTSRSPDATRKVTMTIQHHKQTPILPDTTTQHQHLQNLHRIANNLSTQTVQHSC